MPSIALCLIVKNESVHLERCVKSFAGAFDELIVVDTGSSDNTRDLAKKLGARLFDYIWKDDFAAARQFSFDQATSDLLLWADADDVLRDGDVEKIRWVAEQNKADIHLFNWHIKDHVVERERMMRRGCGQWERTIHELFKPKDKSILLARVKSIEIHHLPLDGRDNHLRNTALLEKRLSSTPHDLFYLATEYQRLGRFEESRSVAEAALCLNLQTVERYELLFLISLTCKNIEESLSWALKAYALMPHRREALIAAAQACLVDKQYARALGFARCFMGLTKPKESYWTQQNEWYGWKAVDLYGRILFFNNLIEEATSFYESIRGKGPPMFSLVHASRGRAKKMV